MVHLDYVNLPVKSTTNFFSILLRSSLRTFPCVWFTKFCKQWSNVSSCLRLFIQIFSIRLRFCDHNSFWNTIFRSRIDIGNVPEEWVLNPRLNSSIQILQIPNTLCHVWSNIGNGKCCKPPEATINIITLPSTLRRTPHIYHYNAHGWWGWNQVKIMVLMHPEYWWNISHWRVFELMDFLNFPLAMSSTSLNHSILWKYYKCPFQTSWSARGQVLTHLKLFRFIF